jgi:Flp pilus assembly protein TadG
MRFSSLVSRWLRTALADRRGTTAIEFAILAPPFFLIIGGILQTAMVFLAQQILDSATQDAARLVRTGQGQTFSTTDFKTQICNELFGLFDCSDGNKFRIYVAPIGNFTAGTTPGASPVDAGTGKFTLANDYYDPGAGSSVMSVKVYYKWSVFLSFMGFSLATNSDGTRLMAAVRVFSNEPFN